MGRGSKRWKKGSEGCCTGGGGGLSAALAVLIVDVPAGLEVLCGLLRVIDHDVARLVASVTIGEGVRPNAERTHGVGLDETGSDSLPVGLLRGAGGGAGAGGGGKGVAAAAEAPAVAEVTAVRVLVYDLHFFSSASRSRETKRAGLRAMSPLTAS